MSERDLAIEATREIEELLDARFDAQGQDMRQKIASVDRELPPEILARIRLVVSVRDMLVAQSGVQILSKSDFILARNEAVDWLRRNQTERLYDRKRTFLSGGRGKLFIPVVVFVAIMTVVLLFSINSLEKTHDSADRPTRLPQIR